MPKFVDAGPDKRVEERKKVLDNFDKTAKNKEKLVELLLTSDVFRGVPFRVDELVVS